MDQQLLKNVNTAIQLIQHFTVFCQHDSIVTYPFILCHLKRNMKVSTGLLESQACLTLLEKFIIFLKIQNLIATTTIDLLNI